MESNKLPELTILPIISFENLVNFWIDYNVQLMLYMKFKYPADLMAINEDMGSILKTYSLNGIRSSNLCQP